MKVLMIRFYSWITTRKEGATAVEYALIVAAIAVAIIVIVFALGGQIQAVFQSISTAITDNAGIAPPAGT